MEDDVCEEYKSSLADLSCNSKPLINMLTMLAEDNVKNAPKIVQAIETHLQKVSHEVKLPVMYLIDSIIKNVGGPYQQLFTQNIVSNFCSVFEKVDEKTRIHLFKLRQTWNEVFPSKKLYAIDVRVKSIDPAWPVTAQPNIHVNPKFLENKPAPPPETAAVEAQAEVRRQLLEKQQELLRLQQQRLELEKLQIQAQLDKQKLNDQISRVPTPSPQIQQLNRPPLHSIHGPDPRRTSRDPRVTARDPRMLRNPGGNTPVQPVFPIRTPIPRNYPVPFVPNKPNIGSNTAPSILVNSSSPMTMTFTTTTTTVNSGGSSSHGNNSPPDVIFVSEVPGSKRAELAKKSQTTNSSTDNTDSAQKQNSQTTHTKSSPKKSSPSDKNADVKPSSKTKKDDSVKHSPNKSQKDKRDAKTDSNTPEILPELGLNNRNSGSPKKKYRESNTSVNDNKGSKQGSKDRKAAANKEDTPRSPTKKKPAKKSDKSGGKNKNQTKTSPEKGSDDKGRQSSDVDLRIQGTFNDAAVKERTNQKEDSSRGRKNAAGDIDENGDAPAKKKSKDDLARVDSLFGEEDKDYRIPRTTDVEPRAGQKNWAQYKASHPDEFKSPIRPNRDSIDMDIENFADDRDFRNRGKFEYPNFRELPAREAGVDRLGRPLLSKMKSFSRWRHVTSPNPYDPSIEHQMKVMLSNRESIIRQAEEQFRSGRISSIQHQEFLADLKRLNEFQNNPHFPVRERWMNTGRNLGIERMDVDPLHESTLFRDAVKGRDVSSEPVFIDGELRRLHFIGQTAVVFVANGEPREVCFQGSPVDVFIDEQKIFCLEFSKTREFQFGGSKHFIKFGSPSREVYIDGHHYKVQFGGSPIPIFFGGKMHHLRLGDPQPSVKILNMPLNDQVAGFPRPRPRNNLEADFQSGNNNTIDIDMRNASRTRNDPDFSANVKDVDMRVNSRPLLERDVTHSPLYDDVGRNTPPPPRIPDENLGPGRPPLLQWEDVGRRDEHTPPNRNQPLLDNFRNVAPEREGGRWNSPSREFRSQGMDWPAKEQVEWEQREEKTSPQFGNYMGGHEITGRRNWDDWRVHKRGAFRQSKGSPQHFEEYQYPASSAAPSTTPLLPLQRNQQPFNPSFRGKGNRGGFRNPGSFMGGPRGHSSNQPNPGPRFQHQPRPNFPVAPPNVAGQPHVKLPSSQKVAPAPKGLLPVPTPPVESVAPSLDINSLFAKLVSVGLIQSESSEPPTQEEAAPTVEVKPERKEKEEKPIAMPAVELTPESLKGRYPIIVTALYKGIQCASCGLRFSEVQNEKYRQHLDWHFRSNRREKDGAKKAFSRKWYYDVEDWTQFEEVEDLEDRARSFFELQADEEQFQTTTQPTIASVPTSKEEMENVCVVCGERFELLWVEEEEEWHLKDAVRIEEKTYHPLCYEDFKKASEAPETPVDSKSLDESLEKGDDEIKKEGTEKDEEQKMEIEEVVDAKEEGAAASESTEEKSETMETDEPVLEEEAKEEAPATTETLPEPVEEEPSMPEEEIIGLISETDPPSEDEMPNHKSEMVVMQSSGSIIMKVKAESIAQATSSTPPPPATDENSKSAQKTDVETDTEDELILPPPDPRFTVLPPVQRGEELSGLCSIM